MAAKSEPGIYLGHDAQYNSPTVLLLRTNKAVTTRNVRFLNNRFTHMRAFVQGREAMEAAADGAVESDTGPDHYDEDIPAPVGVEQPSATPAERRVNFAEPESGGPPDSDDDEEHLVEKILRHRVRDGVPEYRVRWKGYNADDDTWEPLEKVKDLAALDEYEAAHPPQEKRVTRSSAVISGGDSDDTELEFDDDSTGTGKMAMAMATLHGMAVMGDWLDEEPLQRAMAAVAAESGNVSDRTPQTLKEAMASSDAKQWQAARQKEYDSCVALKTWEEVDRASLPKGTNILPLKEVFKIKVNENGKITQFKARFTPKGFRQKAGVDYNETFARTAMYKTERLALALCALFDNELVQFDVPTAFLNADMEELVYVELPKGFCQEGKVARLLKSLYGCKQSPRNWDRLIHAWLIEDGWTPTVSDPSFYWKRSRTGRLMLIYRFVDDMQGQHNKTDLAEFEECATRLRERFNIKQMETATWMLGMRINRDRAARTITLDQQLYIETALKRFGLHDCAPRSTPEAVGARNQTGESPPADRQRFMEITGTLMYASISSRPDIAHAVHYLASNMIAPTARHMVAAEHVLRYLAGTASMGLVFGSRSSGAVADSCNPTTVECCAYADADWAGDHSDRKSISGWVAKVNGDPISWSSKKQKVVSLSTCEAELYAEAAAIQEVIWIRGILAELGLGSSTPSTVYGDNQSAIAVSKNGVKSQRTKHVDVKYHFVTDTIETKQVKLQWIPTVEQQADIFTKALDMQSFQKLRAHLLMG